MKRDVETVLTYPAVMGSVFVLALQAGVSLGPAVVAACVVVVLAAPEIREMARRNALEATSTCHHRYEATVIVLSEPAGAVGLGSVVAPRGVRTVSGCTS